MKTINKTQERMLKKINKTLSDVEVALLNFESDCFKKRRSSAATVDDRIELEEFIRQIDLSIDSLRGSKTHIQAICDIAEI